MNLKRILVAINSQDARDAAFERALPLARASGAELYLLHAVPLNQRFSFRAAERLERMAELRTRAEDAGVRVQTVEQRGDPAEIIELHANAREADLVVLGGEPRRGRQRSPVAERVVRRTRVPALVVPSDGPGHPVSFRNVLVAVDLSPASQAVLEGALELTAGDAERLTVVHTVKPTAGLDTFQSPAWWIGPEYRTHVVEDAKRTLESLASAVPAGIDTRVQVSTGAAARTILEHAAAADADLVVVGRSRGLKMLGSTALRILRRSDRALLVIPGQARRTGRIELQRAA